MHIVIGVKINHISLGLVCFSYSMLMKLGNEFEGTFEVEIKLLINLDKILDIKAFV